MHYENFFLQREDENFIVLCVPWDATEKEVINAANHMRPVIGGWRISGSPQDCKYSENKSHFSLCRRNNHKQHPARPASRGKGQRKEAP